MGGDVVAVGFVPPDRLRELAADLDLPFTLLHDREYKAYRAFGLSKGSFWAIYGPGTIRSYISLMLRGRPFKRTKLDRYQLGGDFVIDGKGTVRLAHRSKDPSDRPSTERLVAELKRAVDGGQG